MSNIRLAITTGEPSGIGPDIALQMASEALLKHTFPNTELVLIGDQQLLVERAKLLKINVPLNDFSSQRFQPLSLLHTPCNEDVNAGTLNPNNANYVLNILDLAAYGCLECTFQGMVTAPVNKGVINDAGIAFSGHTEYLQELCSKHEHTDLQVVMMLATQTLRVCLATTHLPLSQVPAAITEQTLTQVIGVIMEDLKTKFGIQNPTLLVCGLNPHAGENGHLGREELDIIIPTLDKLREKGYQLIGPLPADTLFIPENLKQGDAVLAMYHDQGLPVLKSQGFGKAVNITLGLPIIRTSVDHGTALDLAGTGQAKYSSLETATRLAEQMARASFTA